MKMYYIYVLHNMHISLFFVGEGKVNTCVKHAESTQPHTGASGKQTIQQEVDSLQLDWNQYQTNLNNTKTSLQNALEQWKV